MTGVGLIHIASLLYLSGVICLSVSLNENIDPQRVKVLSDHMDTAFSKAFGTLIPALRISARALFVLDKEGTIQHVEYVGEVADHPNYDAALACARKLVG